ncbi:Ni/Fe-hydrogenase 1 b-type cytochrome subunit [Escherichia coli]|nr:Ni/Fe-hydrogenase 1 b-type cytochrome subunit [Escherichia coli]
MQQKSDNVVSHYVFEAPVRIWHWLTVLCMAVLMVTGYFIGKPLPSVSGEATYLFYMGYIRLIHFSAGMVFTVVLLMRIYWAFVGNRYSRELFIVPVWRKSWWQGVWYEIRWYLFLAKRPSADIGHNPIAQAAMFGYFLMSVFMIITGLRCTANTASTLFLRRSVMWWNFSTGRVATQWTFTAGIGWGCG